MGSEEYRIADSDRYTVKFANGGKQSGRAAVADLNFLEETVKDAGALSPDQIANIAGLTALVGSIGGFANAGVTLASGQGNTMSAQSFLSLELNNASLRHGVALYSYQTSGGMVTKTPPPLAPGERDDLVWLFPGGFPDEANIVLMFVVGTTEIEIIISAATGTTGNKWSYFLGVTSASETHDFGSGLHLKGARITKKIDEPAEEESFGIYLATVQGNTPEMVLTFIDHKNLPEPAPDTVPTITALEGLDAGLQAAKDARNVENAPPGKVGAPSILPIVGAFASAAASFANLAVNLAKGSSSSGGPPPNPFFQVAITNFSSLPFVIYDYEPFNAIVSRAPEPIPAGSDEAFILLPDSSGQFDSDTRLKLQFFAGPMDAKLILDFDATVSRWKAKIEAGTASYQFPSVGTLGGAKLSDGTNNITLYVLPSAGQEAEFTLAIYDTAP